MDKEISKCPICGEVVDISRPVTDSNNATTFKYYKCPRCGRFRMMAWEIDQYRESLFLVSAWIREQNEQNWMGYSPFLVPGCDEWTNDVLRNTLQGSNLSIETPDLSKPTDPVGLLILPIAKARGFFCTLCTFNILS